MTDNSDVTFGMTVYGISKYINDTHIFSFWEYVMNKYVKRYLIDALGGMAQGLFASLLTGTKSSPALPVEGFVAPRNEKRSGLSICLPRPKQESLMTAAIFPKNLLIFWFVP